MLKFTSCNKENENLSDGLLPQVTLRGISSSKCSKKSSPVVTKINLKSENTLNRGGNLAIQKDNILLNHSTINSLCEGKNKNKLRSKNLKLRQKNPLAQDNTYNHDTNYVEAQSNSTPGNCWNQTPQAPLNIPKNLKLNAGDLKLKSRTVQKPIICMPKKNDSKSNINSFQCAGDIKSFAFFERELKTLHSHKKNTICRADKEAFDVFSFPLKQYVDKQSISYMGSMKYPVVQEKENSNLQENSASLKSNLPTKFSDMNRKSNTEESNSNVDNIRIVDNKIMTKYLLQTKNSIENTEVKLRCLEESQFVSPVLGSLLSAEGKDSAPMSPILDSKVEKTLKPQAGKKSQSRESSLSPVLNRKKHGYKEKNVNLKTESLDSNGVIKEKHNLLSEEYERDNYDKQIVSSQTVVSPVLDLRQCKRDTFMQKFKTASCTSRQKPKLYEEEFSPSPVLDASQFKQPSNKSKYLSREFCINSTLISNKIPAPVSSLSQNNGPSKVGCETSDTEIQHDEHFKRNLRPKEHSSAKKTECKDKEDNARLLNSLSKLNNEGFNDLSRPKLNTLEEPNEPLSQVLGSSMPQYIFPDNINATKTKLGNHDKFVYGASVSEDTLRHPHISSNFNLIFSGLVGNDTHQNHRQYEGKFPLFSCQEELVQTCSPVLDASQFKSSLLEKQSENQSQKAHERPKESIGTRSSGIENGLDYNETKRSKSHCNEKISISMEILPSKPSSSFLAVSVPEHLLADCNYSCGSIATSKTEPNKCFTDPITAGSCSSYSLSKHSKRPFSPVADAKLKLKKQKSEICREEIKCLGPMLGSVLQSPIGDNCLCPNVSNLDQDETLINSPSFNSELDIRKFPIMIANTPEQCSPKDSSGKLHADDSDTVMSSQPIPKSFKMRHCKEVIFNDSCRNKIESKVSADKCELLSVSGSLIADSTGNPASHCPDVLGSPILLSNSACNKPNLSIRSHKNDKENISFESCIQNQSTGSDPNSYSQRRKSGKRHVKKNLALYYKEDKQSNKLSADSRCENLIRKHPKDKLTKENAGLLYESKISGIGKLQTLPFGNTDVEKLPRTCVNRNINRGQMSQVIEDDSPDPKWVKPLEPGLTKSAPDTNRFCKSVHTQSRQQSLWSHQIQVFEDNEEIRIEDFDEESPLDKGNVELAVNVTELDSVKRNLNHNFDQNHSHTSKKQAVPEVKSILLEFVPEDQSKNTFECMSSEESSCEVEIQEYSSQRTSDRSPAFRIEYSTTPTTKSSEETQNEAGSNPPSFPPPLAVEANISPSAGVLDSACKNRRTRLKKGSAVERLRRLVRGQRAEVNMFHHEGSAMMRARARVCSLWVTSATESCSMLVLNCRYVDAQRTSSQEFGSGEEVVDPEVHVYLDPSYAKNVTAGCTVTVFPPWHSVWYESRGAVVMYCVTKLRLGNHNQSLIGSWASRSTNPSTAVSSTLVEFHCQSQEDHCGCRSQLVGQLFTVPLQPQAGAVQPRSGADGGITAVLAEGWYPHRVRLKLTVLHTFQDRSRHNQVQPRVLCVDTSGQICQINLRSEQDLLKLGPLKETLGKTFLMKKLTVCRRILIDRCKGLRSFLSYLHADSTNQQMLYVATPSSDEWTAQLIETPDSNTTADFISRIINRQQELLSLPISEEVEGRARARVRVMAIRRDELFVWDPQLDSYHKLNISPSAAIPNFPARSCLDILYLWAHHGELTIDKFTEVSIVEAEDGDSPEIPPLAVDSTVGNLVLLDSIVTQVSSEAYLRWEGSCGHKVLRVQKTDLYFCPTCRQTSSSCTQKVVLEICVAAVDIPYPIRVKVKSETARVLLADTSGQISSEKSYNMIGVIGSTLKCLAVVSEVLRNSLGDIIEFILEEL